MLSLSVVTQGNPHKTASSSSTPLPRIIGVSYAVDGMRRYKQYIFILQEIAYSYTITSIINDESHETFTDVLRTVCAETCSQGDGGTTICVYPALGLVTLRSEPLPQNYSIVLQIGIMSFFYKSTVTEYVIMELGLECIPVFNR